MSKKVLVVDDSQTVRQQVSIALSQAGYEVLEANDGIEGFDKIDADGEIKLVVCDVNMPRMNGLEMVEKVRGETKFDKLPIVMLTTEGAPQLIARAKKAGAKGWIVKPFKADLLVKAVDKLTAA